MKRVISFKIASQKAFEIAEKELKELDKKDLNSTIKRGLIMIISQNYFYAGEYGLKYLLCVTIDNFKGKKEGRRGVLDKLKKEGHKYIDKDFISDIRKDYYDLLNKKDKYGNNLRISSPYMGNNSESFSFFIEFARKIQEAIKIEDGKNKR